jgi:hypothetical protein
MKAFDFSFENLKGVAWWWSQSPPIREGKREERTGLDETIIFPQV